MTDGVPVLEEATTTQRWSFNITRKKRPTKLENQRGIDMPNKASIQPPSLKWST